jgi:DNA-binding NarL/FixJ family response regulator
MQKVLIFGLFECNSNISELLSAGITGLVLKTDPASDIVDAIEALQRNRMYFTRSVDSVILGGYLQRAAPHPKSERSPDSLTLREQEVAQLLAEGWVTKEIGTMLGMSFRTAATHRSNLMRKLRVHNIAEMTLQAISHGIIEVPTLKVLADVIEINTRVRESAAKAAA